MNKFKYSNDNKRYYTLNYYYRNKYNSKVFKVSLNAGFGCPNKKNGSGCIYCLNGSGENRNIPLTEQFNIVKETMEHKWKDSKYIGYFQADTNTYAPLNKLKDDVPYFKEGMINSHKILDRADTPKHHWASL